MGVQVKLGNPLTKRAIFERFCGEFPKRRGAIAATSSIRYLYLYRSRLVGKLGDLSQCSSQPSRGRYFGGILDDIFTVAVNTLSAALFRQCFCLRSQKCLRSSFGRRGGSDDVYTYG